MKEDILPNIVKTAGILFLVLVIVFVLIKSFKLQMNIMEGLTNPTTTTSTTSATSTTTATNGIAGSAANYATQIKNMSIQLQDTLLVSKYRTDYENIIMNLDEYISLLMLQNVLSFNSSSSSSSSSSSGSSDSNMSIIEKLNTLNSASSGLNAVMKYLDSH